MLNIFVSKRFLIGTIINSFNIKNSRNFKFPSSDNHFVDYYSVSKKLYDDKTINAIDWSFDGKKLATLTNFGNRITIWDSKNDYVNPRSFELLAGSYPSNSLSFLKDGSILTTAPLMRDKIYEVTKNSQPFLLQWDTESGSLMRSLKLNYIDNEIWPLTTFSLSKDGSILVGISKNYVYCFNTYDWSIIRTIKIPPTEKYKDAPSSICLSYNGSIIIVGTVFGYVHFYNLNIDIPKYSIKVFDGDFNCSCSKISISPDGCYFATGHGIMSIGNVDNGWTKIWNVHDGSAEVSLYGGNGPVRAIDWKSSSKEIAVGDDKSCRIWNTKNKIKEIELIENFPSECSSIKYSINSDLAFTNKNSTIINSNYF